MTRLLSIIFLAITALAARADSPLEGTHPAQWRLVWNRDPATSATLVWNTAVKGTKHQVRYGIRGEQERKTIDAQASGVHSAGKEKIILHYHQATLTGLKPQTAYEVEMISDGKSSPKFYFVTAPAHDRDFSVLFGGDSRSDRKQRRTMNMAMSKLFAESQTKPESAQILALAHGGDYVESGKSLAQWSEWMSDHELTTAPDGRLLPVIPTRGNHDGGPLFNEIFAFPTDHKNYYGLNLGPQVRLVTLNTEAAIAGNQSKWLKSELAAVRSKSRWLLAQYHRPAYPAVKSPSEALKFWVPLFEQFNVDLVLEADGHALKRTVPIRNGELDHTGIVYVGEGGLGVKQRPPKATRWFLDKPGMSSHGHHVQLLTFTKSGMEYRAIDPNGKTLDHAAFKPRLQPRAVSAPAKAAALAN